MHEGLYRAEFTTGPNGGAGVAELRGGIVHGGDGALYYFGVYQVVGSRFTATVETKRHSPGVQSVFGSDNVSIALEGQITGDMITATGKSPQAPGVPFGVRLTRLL